MLFFRIVLVYCLLTACSFAHFGNSKQKWLEFKVKQKKNAWVSVYCQYLYAFFFLQKTYNKQYHNLEEENNRFITFLDNQKKINKHNQLYAVGEVTYTLKSNQFADLSHKEFLTKYVADRAYGKRYLCDIFLIEILSDYSSTSWQIFDKILIIEILATLKIRLKNWEA